MTTVHGANKMNPILFIKLCLLSLPIWIWIAVGILIYYGEKT